MGLPKVGLEAAIENLGKFDTGASNIVKAYNTIEKKAGDVGKATQAMGLKFDEVANRWRTTSGQFASNAQLMAAGVENPKKAIEELGKKADVAKGKTVGLGDALKALGSPLSALGGQFVGLGDSLLKVGAIAGGAALAGILALGAGIATVTVSGIGQAKDLDQQIANIAATMGKTKEEIAPLKQEILDLSLNPNLTVNVTQAADAIQLLAQNGLTTTQILGGAAESTVALANATGAEFATAANIATGAMQNFNLEASDLTKVADGITGVLVGTKFVADDYSGALAQAGGIMGSLGVTIEDFNTALAASAASFASGSDAGTSFKTFLQRLSNPTDEAKAALEKYGIALFDDTGKMNDLSVVAEQLNKVFQGQVEITETVGGATKKEAAAAETAAKNIDSLRASLSTNQKQLQLYNDQLALEIGYYGAGSPKVRAREIQIEKLNNAINKQTGQLGDYEGAIARVDEAQVSTTKSLVTLTEAQKAELATIIGGADASRTVLALSKLTGDEFKKLSKTVNLSGQASKAAATRVDSLSGAWEILKGIIQAIQIQVGDLFLPILRQVTSTLAGLATGNSAAIVAFFDSLITKGQELFTAFSKYGAGGLLAALGLEGGGLLFKKISELMVLIMGDAGTLADTLTNTLGTAFSFLSENLLPALTVGVQFVIDHFDEIKGALLGVGAVLAGGVFAAIVAGIASLVSPILLVVAGAALLGAAWAGNWGGIQEKTMAVWEAIQPALIKLGDWLGVALPAAGLILSDFWTNTLSPAISTFINFLVETAIPAWFELWNVISTNVFTAISGLSDLWTGTLLPALTAVWSYISVNIVPLFKAINELIGAVAVKAGEALAAIWKNILLPALVDAGDYIAEIFSPAFEYIGTLITDKVSPPMSEFSTKILPKLRDGLKYVTDLLKKATDFFNGLVEAVKRFQIPPQLLGESPPPFANSLDYIAQAANSAAGAMAGFNANLVDLDGIGRAAIEASQALAGMSIDTSTATLDKLLNLDRNMLSIANKIKIASSSTQDFVDTLDNVDEKKFDILRREMKGIFGDEQKRNTILNTLRSGTKGVNEQVDVFKSFLPSNLEKIGLGGANAGAVNNVIGHFLKAFQESEQKLKDMQHEAFIQAGRTAISIGSSLADIISSSADVLDNRVLTLQSLVNSGLAEVNFEGSIISATEAQRQLNQALLEQQAIQDDLLETQQNQAKLDFLNKQLDLLETIKKAGLDPKDILGGLELGLDASIPDIIAATNRLVTAMVNQVNEDLQIASPSKVMARAGKSTGLGFGLGMLASIPDVMKATSRMISAVPSMVSAPALGGGTGSSNVSNYNFNATINTGATPQAVLGQFAIMQAMVG